MLIIGFFGVGSVVLWAAALTVPDLESFEKRKVEQSTKIYDRTGEVLLYDLHENIQRTVVPFSEISRHIKNASVAIEDAEFYEHKGVKLTAIIRATLVNLGSLGFTQGGSTITQQVVKNSLLTSEKTIARKIKEWALALKLEQKISKEEILELYLNETPYGGSVYGVEEASHAFFGKSAADVELAEAAYLASLPQAPTYYSPYGNHQEELENRKNLVLSRMKSSGFITDKEYDDAKTEVVEFMPQRTAGIRAPHFVFFVREYLESKYGERALDERGFRVITTLDAELQARAEEIVYKFAIENEEKFNAENAGLVALDPKTGQVLVMVGSRDYFDENIDGNFNVTLSHRQPGSAFKPFVYATAFDRGYTPDTVVFDVKTQFSTLCEPDDLTSEDDECYSPVNYDGEFIGPVTFRNALAQSINVPSVKALYLAGLEPSLKFAKDMGITSLTDISQYGLTLVLGGGEVSLLELTSAYGVFAAEGMRNPDARILRIEDSDGSVLEEFTKHPVRVLDEDVARMISDVLSDNEARAPAFGQYSALYFPGKDIAAKTGTTNDFRDAWIVGYSPTIAVGAWAGNNDNSPMEKKVAGFIVAPMWNTFMGEVLEKLPNEHFTPPPIVNDEDFKPILRGLWRGGTSYTIDTFTGKLATAFTPPETREEKVVTDIHSLLYWVDKNDPLGEKPKKPEKDLQFERWEYSVQEWKKENGIENESEDVIPTTYDTAHTPERSPKVTILSPQAGVSYGAGSRISVSVGMDSAFPIKKVDFFVNGVLIGSSNRAPFSLSFIPADTTGIERVNRLRIVAFDTIFNKGTTETLFNVNF